MFVLCPNGTFPHRVLLRGSPTEDSTSWLTRNLSDFAQQVRDVVLEKPHDYAADKRADQKVHHGNLRLSLRKVWARALVRYDLSIRPVLYTGPPSVSVLRGGSVTFKP